VELTMTFQELEDYELPQRPEAQQLPGGLSPIAIRLYSYAVTRLSFLPDELVDALQLTVPEIEAAVSELIQFKLLQQVPGCSGRLESMSPESAADLLVVPLERQLREQRSVISKIRMQVQALAPEYEAGTAYRRRSRAVEVLFDRSDASDLIEESARLCTAQAIASRPGGSHDTETLDATIARDEEMLARGVAMRILYQHAARYHPPTVACAERLTRFGAEIRTIGDQLMESIVFDLSIGIMEPEDSQPLVLIREPNILKFMVASFDRSWLLGEPLFMATARKVSDDLGRAIMSLLTEGKSDKSIARRLGISERTCQRHVRNVMIRLNAKSRFQAGYMVGAAFAAEQTRDLGPSADPDPSCGQTD
jgi:hypothetical protein